jgi:hypothetical protein
VVAFNRSDWSSSIETGGRHHPVRACVENFDIGHFCSTSSPDDFIPRLDRTDRRAPTRAPCERVAPRRKNSANTCKSIKSQVSVHPPEDDANVMTGLFCGMLLRPLPRNFWRASVNVARSNRKIGIGGRGREASYVLSNNCYDFRYVGDVRDACTLGSRARGRWRLLRQMD